MIPAKKKYFLILLKFVWNPIEENKLMKYFKEQGFSEVFRNSVSPLIMFLNSSLSGRFVVQAPSDESVSPPKIIMSLSFSSVGDEKFLPEDPSCN